MRMNGGDYKKTLGWEAKQRQQLTDTQRLTAARRSRAETALVNDFFTAEIVQVAAHELS
jgi:hypothetical protein